MTTKGYLTAKEAAAYLSTPYRTFDKWVRAEGIPCVWVGRTRRFRKDTLDQVLQTIAARRRAS